MAIAPSIHDSERANPMIASCHIDGNRLYLVLNGQIDDDMPPTADDFTVASETKKIRVNALDVKVHNAQTVLLLLLDDVIESSNALLLKYLPQQWMMCWTDTEDGIEPFEQLLDVRPIDALDPALRLKTNVNEAEERRDISASNVAVLIRSAYEFLVQIEFNVHLQAAIPPNVNDFRAELEDRWLSVTQARYVKTAGTDTPILLLELSERLEIGERLVIGYRSPNKRLRTIDDEAIPTFSCETIVEGKPLNEIIDEEDLDTESLERIRQERQKRLDSVRQASDQFANDVFSTELHDDAHTIARKAAEERAALDEQNAQSSEADAQELESSDTSKEGDSESLSDTGNAETSHVDNGAALTDVVNESVGQQEKENTVTEEITSQEIPDTPLVSEAPAQESVPTKEAQTAKNTEPESAELSTTKATTETTIESPAEEPPQTTAEPIDIGKARAASRGNREDEIPRIIPPSEYTGDEVFTENLAQPYYEDAELAINQDSQQRATETNTASANSAATKSQTNTINKAANATIEQSSAAAPENSRRTYAKLIYVIPIAVCALLILVAGIYIANLKFDANISSPTQVITAENSNKPAATPEITYKREDCVLKSADGSVYEGECAAGQQDGKGVYTWASGNRYEGEWLGGKRHGKGKLTYATGAAYEGEYRAGREHGHGKMRWPNGASYEGGYRDGRFHGEGVYISASGNQYRGIFNDGSMTQEGTCTMKSGESYQGPCRSK